MFGIFLAGLCAFSLSRLWRARSYGRFAYAGGGRCGAGPRGRGGRFSGHGGWHGRRRGFGRILEELDLTAEQETALRQSIREMAEAWGQSQSPWGMAGTVASALKAETFDSESFLSAGAPNKDEFRKAVARSISRLRETLNPEQRRKLADLLNRRFGGEREEEEFEF